MSVIFDWELLSQKPINEKVKSSLNLLAGKLDLPKFLKSLEIAEIDFGAIPPKVCISNVTDPLPEFYFPVELSAAREESSDEDGILEGNGAEVNTEPILEGEDVNESDESSSQGGSESMMASFLGMIRDDRDLQVEVSIEYSGDIRVVATAILSADSPFKNFISIPITFTISEISVVGTAIMAFIGDRINFCFKESPEEGDSIIRNIKIESEIGSKEKQVLKNMDGIERYIVSSIRKLLDERLVFPNNHSFILA